MVLQYELGRQGVEEVGMNILNQGSLKCHCVYGKRLALQFPTKTNVLISRQSFS